MWRYLGTALILAATLAFGLLIESVLHDETTSSVIAGGLGVFGVALLWPVEFGLKPPPSHD